MKYESVRFIFMQEVKTMNAVIEAIKTRRSVKSYKPDMVPEDVLERIIEAGTYAASGMNRQLSLIHI